MRPQSTSITGKAALEALAARFPQLYVAPAEDSTEAYRLAALRGVAPQDCSLEHFSCDPDDVLYTIDTPAGPVEVLSLVQRQDFDTFLQIIEHKAQPVPIPASIGAKTYLGLANWQKVAQLHSNYVASGGDDWAGEFSRLAKDPTAFRDQLIVVSSGPYSGIPHTQTGYDEADWRRISKDIRLYHECAHVVCRRLMPDDVLPIWDELTADMVGLLCATGSYDTQLASLFLGVSADSYDEGRLEQYLDEEQLTRIDQIAREVFQAVQGIEERCAQSTLEPFDLLLELKRSPLLSY